MSWNGSAIVIDRHCLAQAVAKGKKSLAVLTHSFPTPAGATWEDVRLTVGDTHVRIEVLGRRKEFTFQQAGFEDKRRGDIPDRLWLLLGVFAVHGGILPSNIRGLPQKVRDNLKQNVSQLGKRLGGLLLLEGSPFKDSRKMRRYETRFKIAAEEGDRFDTPEGVTWDEVSITESEPGVVAVSVMMLEAFVTFAPSNDEEGGGRWEGAQGSGSLSRKYDLRTLGLARDDGRPNEVGEALLALLTRISHQPRAISAEANAGTSVRGCSAV